MKLLPEHCQQKVTDRVPEKVTDRVEPTPEPLEPEDEPALYKVSARINKPGEKFREHWVIQVRPHTIFVLPGAGGKLTQEYARRIVGMWQAGKTIYEITEQTGCERL